MQLLNDGLLFGSLLCKSITFRINNDYVIKEIYDF